MPQLLFLLAPMAETSDLLSESLARVSFFCFWPSSQQLLGLDQLKLSYRLGSELMAVLAKVALLQAFLAAVILTSLHHAVTATVGTPSVLSSHRSA
jgi:hypothetical protein